MQKDIRNLPAIRRVTAAIWKTFNNLDGLLVEETDKSIELAQQYFEEGEHYDDQDDIPKALSGYQRCLKKKPNHAGALLAIGEIYKNFGLGLDKAQLFVERAVVFAEELNNRLNSLQILAWILQEQDKHLSALCRFQEMLIIVRDEISDDDPKIGDVYFEMGTCYFKMEDWDNAFSHYKVSYKLDGEYVPTALLLGEVCERGKKWDLAMKYYEIASKWDGEGDFVIYKAYDGMGKVLAQRKKYPQAIEMFYKLLGMLPDEVGPHIRILGVYARQKNMKMMEEHLKETIRLVKKGQFDEGIFLSEIMSDDYCFHNNKCRDLVLREVYQSGFIPKEEYDIWIKEDCD